MPDNSNPVNKAVLLVIGALVILGLLGGAYIAYLWLSLPAATDIPADISPKQAEVQEKQGLLDELRQAPVSSSTPESEANKRQLLDALAKPQGEDSTSSEPPPVSADDKFKLLESLQKNQ